MVSLSVFILYLLVPQSINENFRTKSLLPVEILYQILGKNSLMVQFCHEKYMPKARSRKLAWLTMKTAKAVNRPSFNNSCIPP